MQTGINVHGPGSNAWLLLGWVVLLLLLAPLITLLGFSVFSWLEVEPDLHWLKIAGRTILLGTGASLLATIWGVSAAWLIEMCIFPARRLCGLLLFLPFALPPYVMAYLWGDLIDDSLWLPSSFTLRNMVGACFVMSLALFPYVYMLARATFASRSCTLLAIARMLGCSPAGAFFKVALPMARPAIAIGALLVFMEVTNDIAVAQNYGIRTLGSHIYDLWLNRDQQGAAIAVSSLLVVIAFVLFAAELVSRAKQRQYEASQNYFCCTDTYQLSRPRAALALAYCAGLITVSLLLPVAILLQNTFNSQIDWGNLFAGIGATFSLMINVVILGFVFGTLLTLLLRSCKTFQAKFACQLAMAGYALPGVVYGLGVLIIAGSLADLIFEQFELSLHFLWITSSTLLTVALASRYVLLPAGSLDTALNNIPPQLGAAGRLAGKSTWQMLLRFWLPLLRPSLLVGGLLLATDIIKELPLTLILRPFELNTLAIQIYQYASDEDISSSAPYALVMVVMAAAMLSLSYRWIVPTWIAREEKRQA